MEIASSFTTSIKEAVSNAHCCGSLGRGGCCSETLPKFLPSQRSPECLTTNEWFLRDIYVILFCCYIVNCHVVILLIVICYIVILLHCCVSITLLCCHYIVVLLHYCVVILLWCYIVVLVLHCHVVITLFNRFLHCCVVIVMLLYCCSVAITILCCYLLCCCRRTHSGSI